jgi:hypothetical protein
MMKREKTYCYPYRYIRLYLEDKFENSEAFQVFDKSLKNELKNESIANLVIKISDDKHDITVKVREEHDFEFSYTDNGATMVFLKGLGKISTIADIASRMDSDSGFDIDDEFDNKFGIQKIHTMDNDYLIAGGYKNWSTFINIDGYDKDKQKDMIILALLRHSFDCGFPDFKTMYIRVSEDVARYISSDYFKKPYIYFINKKES